MIYAKQEGLITQMVAEYAVITKCVFIKKFQVFYIPQAIAGRVRGSGHLLTIYMTMMANGRLTDVLRVGVLLNRTSLMCEMSCTNTNSVLNAELR